MGARLLPCFPPGILPPMPTSAVLTHIDQHFDRFLSELDTLSRIPGVSQDPPPSPALQASAQAVVDAMGRAGLHQARVLDLPGAHPYAYSEWLGRPGAPTLLLYAHHDVQPIGRIERWHSPPFEPEIRDGRMYGRGVVDDKAGIVTHLAAIAGWLEVHGTLPCNVKFIVEGEEEVGSDHLEPFLAAHAELLQADCIVLTDTANLDTGVPSITTRLRGLVGAVIVVEGLDHPLHSGMWGGPVPDPVMALVRILARLVDEHGDPAIPGLAQRIRPPSVRERAALDALPFDAEAFARDAGMLPGMRFSGAPDATVYERMWYRPSLTINGILSVNPRTAPNQLTDRAEARVTLRTVPDIDPTEAMALLREQILRNPPFGVRVTLEEESPGWWWSTDPVGPAFEAAARAMEAGYGRPCTFIGCGGSIPFVNPFARVLGGVPALLLGLEDPTCNAHGENESLHLGDWKKGMRSAAVLYQELATALRPTAGGGA